LILDKSGVTASHGDCSQFPAARQCAREIRITSQCVRAQHYNRRLATDCATMSLTSWDALIHSHSFSGDRTLAQNSFISIGRRSTAKHSKDLGDYFISTLVQLF